MRGVAPALLLASVRIVGWLGRILKPRLRALRIEFLTRRRESLPFAPAQTTRTFPGPLPVTALVSDRAVGTLPPAAGLTEVSGAGSGQYDGRSRCAIDTAGNTPSASRVRTASRDRTDRT